MSWKITRLSVTGVKGVLAQSGEFDLPNGKSIAIYAPNGCGKSGYADAVEYLFAKDGAVEHLGQGDADSERGGKRAIPHVLAQERGIIPIVSVTLRNDAPSATISVSRQVKTGRADPIPADLGDIIQVAPAHRILRQHDLRRFVVDMAPRDKYSELARWLGLEHLEDVLTHLTTTKNELAKTDPDREFKERLQDITKHTEGQINGYDLPETLALCCANAREHLGDQCKVTTLAELEQCIESLRQRRDELVAQSGGISERHQAKRKLEDIARNFLSAAGQLSSCRIALSRTATAKNKVVTVLSTAKESVFQEIWEASKRVLEKEPTAQCPVCLTQWEATNVRTQNDAVTHIRKSLGRLSELKKAQSEERECIAQFSKDAKILQTSLQELRQAAEKLSLPSIAKQVDEIAKTIEVLAIQNQDSSQIYDKYTKLLEQCTKLTKEGVNAALPGIKLEEMPVVAKAVDDTVGKLVALKEALSRLGDLQRERDEYREIEKSFAAIADIIQRRAANLVDGVVQALRADVERIYRKIHPTNAVPNVHITPDTKNKTLSLRVDFHSPGRIVPPAGYLSESQINTLGLALFISCVRLFNRNFPFVFLDDIVSSYDADHRARIVDVIAEDLDDFQVFITTHDERFYSILKTRLVTKGWQFDRITGWVFEEGPKREADAPKPDVVEKLIKAGDHHVAGNTIRRFMEEWLDEMCSEYEAHTVHKRGAKEFERTLFDYWDPFITRLKKIKDSFFKHRIEPQPCYQRLKAHPLINYYSHAQSNPYAWGSMGDVQYAWEEFQAFQRLFRCSSCSRTLKYDGDVDKLYCICGGAIFPTESVSEGSNNP